jgi:hypothetical protein
LGPEAAGRRLIFINDLRRFLDDHRDNLNRLDNLAADLRRTKALGDFNLEHELENLGGDILSEMSSALNIQSYEFRNVEGPYYISTFGGPENIEVAEVYGLPGELLVECAATYECSVEGYVNKWDAHDNDSWVVTDFEWNEHYAEVEFQRDIRVRFLVGLKKTERGDPEERVGYEPTSIEVQEVEDATPEAH